MTLKTVIFIKNIEHKFNPQLTSSTVCWGFLLYSKQDDYELHF